MKPELVALPTERSAEDAVATLLRFIGEDTGRDGLLDTPGRVVRACLAEGRALEDLTLEDLWAYDRRFTPAALSAVQPATARTLNMALTHQLIGWDRQHVYAALCAAALGVNVALNARLIPALSIDGAAWATLGTELFLTIGCAAGSRCSQRFLTHERSKPGLTARRPGV